MSSKSHFFNRGLGLVFYDRFNNSNFNEIDNLIPITSNITFQTRIGGFTGVFNGISSIVTYPSTDYFNFSNGTKDKPFTMGGFFKTNAVTNTQIIFGKRNLGVGDEFQLALVGSKLDLILFDDVNNSNIRVKSNTLSSNTDYCYIITYDGSGSESGLNIYINSLLNTSERSQLGNYISIKKTTTNVQIGYRGAIFYFNGNIDNLFVFNYVIDSLQIADITTKVLNNNDIR
jgi:hypothetical protein